MYNPATQVQVFIDTNLVLIFQKNKITVEASPTTFPLKKGLYNHPSSQSVHEWDNSLSKISLFPKLEQHVHYQTV
jgi:hypothetical protein